MVWSFGSKYGVFDTVAWSPGNIESMKMAYIEHMGSYKDIGSVFTALIEHLKDMGIQVSVDDTRFVSAP